MADISIGMCLEAFRQFLEGGTDQVNEINRVDDYLDKG